MGMREIAPFGLRMSAELKARLEEVAKANGRSLNTELLARLTASLDTPNRDLVKEPAAEYRSLTDPEREMLTLFRRWPADRQLAFLVLFK